MNDFVRWFTGGAEYAYHTLAMCMDGDMLWVHAYVASGAYVFLSYLLIVAYFTRRYVKMRKTKFANAMMLGALVFLWCGMSGYLMSGMVSYYWPARRLETIMRVITGSVNIAWAYHLYKISFIEKVLKIDATLLDDRSITNAEPG